MPNEQKFIEFSKLSNIVDVLDAQNHNAAWDFAQGIIAPPTGELMQAAASIAQT